MQGFMVRVRLPIVILHFATSNVALLLATIACRHSRYFANLLWP